MSCTSVQNLISQYLEGRLEGAEANLVLDHVESCARCARDLEDSRFLSTLLKENLDQPEPPSGLPRSVLATVERTAVARKPGSGQGPG